VIDPPRIHSINRSLDTTDLLRGRNYSFDDSGLCAVLDHELDPRMADLVDIALAAHVVDRLEPRPGANSLTAGATWDRHFVVRLGVRDLAYWREHIDSVSSLLRGLTDDDWEFDLHPFVGGRLSSEVALRLPYARTEQPDSVGLFSGGLDSLAGAIRALNAGYRPLLLSLASNPRMAAVQRSLRKMIRRRWPQVWSASAVVNLSGREAREASQRARALLFLTTAGVVAASSGLDRVEVYENGIGAISLPYVASQEGAHTTKAVHPDTLRSVSAVVSVIAQRRITYANPSIWQTKAELCRTLEKDDWHLVPESESCDTAFSYRGAGVSRCGTCTSCLLRRQALWAAGLGQIDQRQQVRLDLLSGSHLDTSASDDLHRMLDQAAHIAEALSQPRPWAALTARFPELLQIVHSDVEERACIAMYAQYISDWLAFPSELVRRYLHPLRSAGGRPWEVAQLV